MQGSYDTAFEDMTPDADDAAKILPNSIQLIETNMLPNRASNWNQLSGTYLFCQIYLRDDSEHFCMLCRNYHNSIAELKRHYQSFHDFAVLVGKAEYDKSANFECAENNPHLIYSSAYCKATFQSLAHLADHYLRWHEDSGSTLLECGATLLKKYFYCGLCGKYINSFRQCLRHMKILHEMLTFVCSHCVYCNPVRGFLKTHELQLHVQRCPDALVQCPVCLMHVRGADRLTKHVMAHHVVRTGPSYWSCATCLRTFKNPLELMEHLKTCAKHYSDNEAASNPSFKKKNRIVFICDSCPLIFASEVEFEKHEDEENHIVGTSEEMILSSMNMEDTRLCDPAIFDHNTCYLCCMRFPSVEMHWKHQHHVHMQWVTKGEAYSGHHYENGNGSTQHIQEPEGSHINQSEPVSENENDLVPVIEYVLENAIPSFTDFVEQQLAQMSGQTIPTHTYHGEGVAVHDQPECVSIPFETSEAMDLDMAELNSNNGENLNKEMVAEDWEVCKVNVVSDIARGGVHVENELADIGFPPKFGHYCHLCDQVIKNYWFYYLHMRNFHRLEKRFKCIVTTCGKVFSGTRGFQDHAFRVHNQKSQCNCRQCDIVFGSEVEAQNHFKKPSHGYRVKRLQMAYGRTYPRNHKCSICHCWFGLFSIFVDHMENNGHIYINNTNYS